MAFSKLDVFYPFLLLASLAQLPAAVPTIPEEVTEKTEESIQPTKEGAFCNSPLDIIIALDASGSVGEENWGKSVDFAGKLADRLLALNTESRLGVIGFSQEAYEAIQLSNDQPALKQGLQNLKARYQNGITRTEKALNKAAETFAKINRNPAAKKILLVISDGQTTPQNNMSGIQLLKGPTEALKAAGVHIIAVGVGTMVDDEELSFMASDPDDENVFHFDSYNALLSMVDQTICPDNKNIGTSSAPKIAASLDLPSESTCPAVYTKIGCFRDNLQSPRPLPELLFTDRDRSMKTKYSGIPIKWKNWNAYMTDLVCRCAKEAKVRNYAFFSIQFFGECWSGPNVEVAHQGSGTVDTCITRDYQKCDPCDSLECVGKKATNFVYSVELPVAEPVCKVTYRKLGCYKDNQKEPRPLPKLLLTDRDPTSPVFSKTKIAWGNWDSYISDLACRCAEKAAENNYHYFGLQFYGECWSGADDAVKYDKVGRDDQICVTSGYKKCLADPETTNKECVGKQRANYVYGIQMIRDALCPVPFKLVGCFKDPQQPTRTLPELLFTDKDKQSKVYSGIPIGWGNWNSYLEDLVCRCSKKAKEKKYSHFGIQYYGECWSGAEAGGTFGADEESDECKGKDWEVCVPAVHHTCAGKAKTNAVYSI